MGDFTSTHSFARPKAQRGKFLPGGRSLVAHQNTAPATGKSAPFAWASPAKPLPPRAPVELLPPPPTFDDMEDDEEVIIEGPTPIAEQRTEEYSLAPGPPPPEPPPAEAEVRAAAPAPVAPVDAAPVAPVAAAPIAPAAAAPVERAAAGLRSVPAPTAAASAAPFAGGAWEPSPVKHVRGGRGGGVAAASRPAVHELPAAGCRTRAGVSSDPEPMEISSSTTQISISTQQATEISTEATTAVQLARALPSKAAQPVPLARQHTAGQPTAARLAAGKSAAGRAAAERASSSTVGGRWWGAAPEEIAAFTEALRASERARLPAPAPATARLPAPATALGAPALPVRSRAADAYAASLSFAPPSPEVTNPKSPTRCVERGAQHGAPEAAAADASAKATVRAKGVDCLALVDVAASSAPTSVTGTARTLPAAPTSVPSTAPIVTAAAAARALLVRLVEPSAAAVLAACDGEKPSMVVIRTALLGQQWPSAWVHAVSSPLCEALLSGATLGEALMTMAIGCGDGEAHAAEAIGAVLGADARPTQPAPVPSTTSSEALDEITISASEALGEIERLDDRPRSTSIELNEVFMRDYDDDSATVPTADVPTAPRPHSATVPTADAPTAPRPHSATVPTADAPTAPRPHSASDHDDDADDAGAGAGTNVSAVLGTTVSAVLGTTVSCPNAKALIAGLLSPQVRARC